MNACIRLTFTPGGGGVGMGREGVGVWGGSGGLGGGGLGWVGWGTHYVRVMGRLSTV